MGFKTDSKIVYKLLHDTLFLLLLVFAVLLLSEGILPGFISSYLSFTKLTLLIFANVAALIYLGRKNGFLFSGFHIRQSRLAFLFIALSFLLLGNAMLKFSYWENLAITFTAFYIFYYFYKVFLPSQTK